MVNIGLGGVSGPNPYSDVNVVLHELLSGVKAILGDYFISIYLGDSLAIGDCDLRQSDIDFIVATDDEITNDRDYREGIAWGQYMPEQL